jgi:hypothetical protein
MCFTGWGRFRKTSEIFITSEVKEPYQALVTAAKTIGLRPV